MSASATRTSYWRFSLRGLFVGILIAAAALAWLAFKVQQGNREARAVAELKEAGADVYYCLTNQDLGGTMDRPGGSALLKPLLGEHFFARVDRVIFFYDENLSDRDLAPIADLDHLTSLNIVDGKVTDAGLDVIGRRSSLQCLSLSGLAITDDGLSKLQRLTTLEDLNLARTRITDTGLAHLQPLWRLRLLKLEGTAITDGGLQNLEVLKKLEVLDLTTTKITDDGVEKLAQFQQLHLLVVGGTKITATGNKKLGAALPHCQITWWPRVPD